MTIEEFIVAAKNHVVTQEEFDDIQKSLVEA